MMNKLLLAIACFVTIGFGHNSYTGGYSGAPGRQKCASSCHGSTGGTLTVTGFPASYQPQQTYRVVIKRTAGSSIVNFNATTRVGSSSTVAGTFTVVTNSTLYTGVDGGVYASPHSIDSAVFQWKAPAAGTGAVNFYLAGYQGTTSSANGQSSSLTLSASELTTGVETQALLPGEFTLDQNYPNPFNPSTEISFTLGHASFTTVKVFNLLGQEIATLVKGELNAGAHRVTFNAVGQPSGLYFYRLETKDFVQTKKMVLTK